MSETSPADRITRLALLFETALGGVALVVGWLAGHWPAVGMGWGRFPASQQRHAIGGGLLATLPLLAALFLIDRFPLGPLRKLRDKAQSLILGMFGGAWVLPLAVA